MSKQKILVSLLVAGGLVSPMAHATNGYFSHGYGMKSKGMAGVGIALPQDSIAAATNPAGMVMVGDRIDFGVDLFRPVRDDQITSSAFNGFGVGNYSGNHDSTFVIPEFGYNKMINADTSIGVSVYGNGGMNTGYEDLNSRTAGFGAGVNTALGASGCVPPACPVNPNNGVFGSGKLGVDLIQLFVAPTYSVKVTPDQALGVSLNMVRQMFRAEGLQNFVPFSSTGANNTTNLGYASSSGLGLKIGWTGNVSPDVTLGATYQTKTKMGKFDKYKGLFAEQGRFDIPETYGLGIAFKATPKTVIAADIQQINYSKVTSIGNSVDNLVLLGNPLGADNGAGFNWRDMTVFKLGVAYEYSKDLTIRGGISTNRQPIPSRETAFNVIAPGVVENHMTLGATWTFVNKSELTLGYMHAFKKTINGVRTDMPTQTAPFANFGNGIDLNMTQDSIGIAYGWKM